MGRNNIKQRNEEYERRTKTRQRGRMGRFSQDLNQADPEDPCMKEQLRIDAKNLIVAILLILFMLAVPSFESTRKNDIINFFGWFLNQMQPVAEQGLVGVLCFAALVALWDGVSVLPVRYAEFLTALSFHTVPEYIAVMLLGKTIGGFITYKCCNALITNEGLEEIILNNGCSFYVSAISDLVRERPIFFGLIFRMFFPSIMNCIALALLPLNQTQFVFIQFLHALILSWPQATLDYFPYIEKRIHTIGSIVHDFGERDVHAEILRRGIDNRTELYKLGFVMAQICALVFLTICVVRRNSQLQTRFNARLKLRLLQINLNLREECLHEPAPVQISLNNQEKKSLPDGNIFDAIESASDDELDLQGGLEQIQDAAQLPQSQSQGLSENSTKLAQKNEEPKPKHPVQSQERPESEQVMNRSAAKKERECEPNELLEAKQQMQRDTQELLAHLDLPVKSFKLSIKKANGEEIKIVDTNLRLNSFKID